MKDNKSPVFMRLLRGPSVALKNALNKFTAEGRPLRRLSTKDFVVVSRFLGEPGVTIDEAVAVGGELAEWRGQPEGSFLFLGRRRKLTCEEDTRYARERLLRGKPDAPDETYRGQQERVNDLHVKIDAALNAATHNVAAVLGNRKGFRPLAHGEVPAGQVELRDGTTIPANDMVHAEQRLGAIVKALRLFLREPVAGSRLAVCENETCGQFFIKTRRDKRRCSPKCTSQSSARDCMRERRRKRRRIRRRIRR